MALHNPSYVAGEDIGPSLVVKMNGDDFEVVKSADGDSLPVGISHEGTREAPIPGVTAKTAASGEPIRIYGEGEVCEGIAGASITAGNLLMADSSSYVIPATTGKYYVGRALRDAASGERVQLQVMLGQLN